MTLQEYSPKFWKALLSQCSELSKRYVRTRATGTSWFFYKASSSERTFPHWAMGILRSVDERIDIVGLLESAFSKPSEDIGLAVRRLLVQSEAESKIIGNLWLC